jgi:DNA-binding NtrC family response regulator
MSNATTLLIADEPALLGSIRDALSSVHQLELAVVATCADAADDLDDVAPALLLVHVATTKDVEAVAGLIRHLTTSRRDVATVLLIEPHLTEDGLRLLRLGAADCLTRPLDLGRLAYLADVLTVRHRLAPRPQAVAAPAGMEAESSFIHRSDGPLGRVVEQVRRIAPLETSVLIQGETGTGKTCLARLIHDLSPRRDQPFLTINCGSLSANVIESELFGHVRGAFTGADRDRVGKLAAVGRGTLLLDDIDGLPLDLQTKLLRVIEDRIFEPVGSNKPQPLQARVIAASNRLLQQEAQAGQFRSDLYYRLGVMVFYLPPLRENRTLLPALAKRFVRQYARRDGRPVRGLMPEALRALEEHDWPGNVRELRNVIERAVALCAGEWIGVEDLPEPLQPAAPAAPAAMPAAPPPVPNFTLAERTQEAEAQVIREALQRNRNNKLRTAIDLGISRMTLYKKLNQYGLMGGLSPA